MPQISGHPAQPWPLRGYLNPEVIMRVHTTGPDTPSFPLNPHSDKLFSVLIPSAFAVVAGASVAKGLFGMYTGTGKMD